MGQVYYPSGNDELRQGEIISDIPLLHVSLESLQAGGLEIIGVPIAFAIVASQDCDLTQDYKARNGLGVAEDKKLQGVLLYEAKPKADALHLFSGSDMRKRAEQNKDERFHLFQAIQVEEDRHGEGMPELLVDFKRYFTIRPEELYWRLEQSARRRCYLKSPYLEHFSTRAAYFQFRVALP